MKKIATSLLILLLPVSVLAGVVVATDETTPGQVTLTLTSDTEITGIGLIVDANANISSFTVDDDRGTPADSFFDIFMDVAYDREVNGNGYTYGEGAGSDNLNGAHQDGPGVVALPAANFSISVCGIGGQAQPLDPPPQVAHIILKGASGTVVNVDLDLLRGGIVDYNGAQTVTGLPVELTIPAVSAVVASAHGQADPAVGTHSYSYGASAGFSITNDTLVQGTTQYVCTGWAMVGHAPAAGTGTGFSITLTNDLVLNWLWATNSSLAPLGTPEWWLAAHGLTNNGDTFAEAESLDGDNDGMEAWEEWICDTIPTNGGSVLQITNIVVDGAGANVFWKGGVQAAQYLERRTNLISGADWEPVFTNEPPTSVSTNSNDAGAANHTSLFYRVKAER